ncbi:MAG: signal recognition particle receptor [Actinomycetota bacterium]
MNQLLLALLVLVPVFGIGVVVWNRRSGGAPRETAAGSLTIATPPVVTPATAVESGAVDVLPGEGPTDGAQPADVATELPGEPPVVATPTIRSRMGRARAALTGAFLGVRSRGGITSETWDELEEALLRADVGVRVTDELLTGLRARVKAKEIADADGLLNALQGEMTSRLDHSDRALHFAGEGADGRPDVWLFVGVNGVGKTTTIGKVSAQQAALGRTVMMAAGDTFRAAAAEQLTTWAERSGAAIVRGNEGGDPASVIFDGIESAAARRLDLVLGDTAGRLHTKSNLMDELRKVRRVAAKGNGNVTEVLLVIDATTGQNGLAQAREFGAATAVGDGDGLTGVVLTKLDGSAKGGIVFAIETELGIPVKLVGLGETIGDLVPFDPAEFVGALFATD